MKSSYALAYFLRVLRGKVVSRSACALCQLRQPDRGGSCSTVLACAVRYSSIAGRTTYGLGSLGQRKGMLSDPLGHRQSVVTAFPLAGYSVGLSRLVRNILTKRTIVERQVFAYREPIIGFGTCLNFVARSRMDADILGLKRRRASLPYCHKFSSNRSHPPGFRLGRSTGCAAEHNQTGDAHHGRSTNARHAVPPSPAENKLPRMWANWCVVTATQVSELRGSALGPKSPLLALLVRLPSRLLKAPSTLDLGEGLCALINRPAMRWVPSSRHQPTRCAIQWSPATIL
jgi:hypothetical protein